MHHTELAKLCRSFYLHILNFSFPSPTFKQRFMIANFKSSLLLAICTSIFLFGYVQQAGKEQELKKVIDQWYTSAGKGDTAKFKLLLTDDFQLIAFGKRFNKAQMMGMVKDYSEISYRLENIRAESEDDVGSISFDIYMDYRYKGAVGNGHAMEVYLFRKVKQQWKVHTKTIVLVENTK